MPLYQNNRQMPRHFQGYTAAQRLRPEWRVQFLVFQGGNPRLKASSMTGGGQIYGHEYGGYFQPVRKSYSTPVTSKVGGGQVAARPGFLQALFGGNVGSSG